MKTISITVTAAVTSDKKTPAEQESDANSKADTIAAEAKKAVAAIGKIGTVQAAELRVSSTRAADHVAVRGVDLKA
jgi:hypothetical protein